MTDEQIAAMVKPLEWVKHHSIDAWRCDTPHGTYKVFGFGVPSWDFDSATVASERTSKTANTVNAAKAAAQADYAARILSAIDTTMIVAERDAALNQRDMWMERAMNEVGENLTLKAERDALRAALDLYEDALTEAEAIFGGEYGDHFGPMCEMAFSARDARTALKGAKP